MFIASEKVLRRHMGRANMGDLTPAIIRAIAKDDSLTRNEKMAKLNRIGEFYGVEYLGKFKATGEDVIYCNAGDSYALTLVAIGHRVLRLTTWGDMVENGEIQEGESHDL
jgi:hypothetical protein